MTERILLVEADEVLGAVMVEVLRHSGCEVIAVNTLLGQGERAASASIVILDVDTTSAEKEMTRLTALHPDDELPPVICIGLQAPEALRRYPGPFLGRWHADSVAWVQKPFRNDELLAAVRQAQDSGVPRQTNGR